MKDLIRSSSPNEKEREKEEEETTQHSYNFHKAMASWKRTSISLGPSLILHQTKKKVLYKVQFQNLFLVLVLFLFIYLFINLLFNLLFFIFCNLLCLQDQMGLLLPFEPQIFERTLVEKSIYFQVHTSTNCIKIS